MTEREALEQLLEALDKELPHNMKHIAAGQRFNARAALAQPEQEPVIGTKTWFEDGKVVTQHLTAKDIYKDPEQPEQEPVAWLCKRDDGHFDALTDQTCKKCFPVYTTPPQRTWVGLTNNDLQPIANEYRILFGSWVHDFARAIEAKLKEKNT